MFRPVTAALGQAGIPYMLTGSFAGAYHGTPRATQDIDLVIAATPAQIRALVRALSANGYYVDEAAALEALQLESQFNAIDPATGWKIDFIIRKSRPFSETEFGRRREAQVEGLTLSIATVEDLILAKLEWARLGKSDRQIEDVAALIRVRRGEVDLSYVGHWVESLGIGVQWERAVRLAGTGSDGEGQQSR